MYVHPTFAPSHSGHLCLIFLPVPPHLSHLVVNEACPEYIHVFIRLLDLLHESGGDLDVHDLLPLSIAVRARLLRGVSHRLHHNI